MTASIGLQILVLVPAPAPAPALVLVLFLPIRPDSGWIRRNQTNRFLAYANIYIYSIYPNFNHGTQGAFVLSAEGTYVVLVLGPPSVHLVSDGSFLGPKENRDLYNKTITGVTEAT